MTRWGRHARRLGVLLLVVALPACGGETGDLGVLRYYPGARVVSSGEFQGIAFGLGPAWWRRTILSVRAPYERVRDFYADVMPAGWASTFENEVRKETGARYDRYLADAARREFYAIQIREGADGTIRILLAHGRAAARPPGTPTPARSP